ncbi:unnamed protein product [Rhizoctonia solani]|uniref:Uncharacterized protein n=1 Tax=Rhizoctonia solani TaxID=456999 RepID=A0A8H2XVS8_9AGAM|nr:unnamed protein product [Rhizoctonia solani]
MPGLSTCLVFFVVLLASLGPVLSLEQGVYWISQTRPGGGELFLHSEYGFKQGVQMKSFKENDERQMWNVTTLGINAFTFSNLNHGCNLRKGGGFPPPALCDDLPDVFSLAPISEEDNRRYYIDIVDTRPYEFSRMHQETILPDVTFTSKLIPEVPSLPNVPDVQISYRKFIFTPVSQSP